MRHRIARPLLTAALLLTALAAPAAAQDAAPPLPQAAPADPQLAELGPWLAVARGTVDVDGGLMRLAAQREGLIAEVNVTEGDHVAAGQLLARLEDGAARLAVDTARLEVDQADAALAAATLRSRHAEAERARLRPLLKADAIPARQGDEAARTAELAAADQRSAEIALSLAKLRLDTATLELTAREIRAPVAGVILRVSARPGDGTSTSTVTEMFLLAPDGQRVMRGTLDEQFVGKVAPGQRARIVSERDAGRQLDGHVLRIAPVFGRPGQTQTDARTVDIVIALDGADADRLILGERLVARILP